MQTFAIPGRMFRAARAMMGLTIAEMAELCDLSPQSLTAIENDESSPRGRTVDKIVTAIKLAGFDVSATGVKERSALGFVIEGKNWWLEVLDLAHRTLKQLPPNKREVLMWFSDDRASPPEVEAKWREMFKDGIRARSVIEEGNTWLLTSPDDYVWWPSARWINNVTAVFGDYVVNTTPTETQGGVINKHPLLATSIRNQFDEYWDTAIARGFKPMENSRAG